MLKTEKDRMVGQVFLGRYEALRLLGEGGMGRVYLGKEVDGRRHVVIKVMHDHIAANPRFRQSFEREMLMMRRFRHPNAVALYDASIDEPRKPCIVMEYVPGITLDALIQRHGRLDHVRVGHLLGQLCPVLQAAHDAGIIHRDLTPVNMMIMNPDTADETLKVMDFGLARLGAAPYIPLEKLTGTGNGVGGGTPDYVCPEQVRGDEVDHRGDLYSVGVLLFKVLTGFLPFETATTPAEILQAHLESPPPRFADIGAGGLAPASIETLVQLCLSKYPVERPQTALELGQKYEKALGRKILPLQEASATPPPPPVHAEKIDPRNVMDFLEAWMPEPIAVVKLRGFVSDVGGEVIESEPGLIRFRLLDPASVPEPAAKGLFSVLGRLAKPRPPAHHVFLELLMEKKTSGQRSQLHITVMMRPEEDPRRADDPAWRAWCGRVCRDLRAYLISR